MRPNLHAHVVAISGRYQLDTKGEIVNRTVQTVEADVEMTCTIEAMSCSESRQSVLLDLCCVTRPCPPRSLVLPRGSRRPPCGRSRAGLVATWYAQGSSSGDARHSACGVRSPNLLGSHEPIMSRDGDIHVYTTEAQILRSDRWTRVGP